MAKKSTRKTATGPSGEKNGPADVKAGAHAEAGAEPAPGAEAPKVEATEAPRPGEAPDAKTVLAAPRNEPAMSPESAEADKTGAPPEPAKQPEIPVSAALMAAAIANRRRLARWLNSRAAVVAVAAGLGAVVGSVVSSGLGQAIAIVTNDGGSESALRAGIARLTTEVASLKAQLAGSDDAGATQRMLAGADMADAGDPALVSPEITGSIGVASPPVAEGWTLWRVRNGRALVQGDSGYFEVAPGSRLPGLGLVERIAPHGDGWAVETRGGLILPRG